MRGLRHYAREVAPLLACGDDHLAPPVPDELLALVREHLVRPGSPEPLEACWVYARWKPAISLTAGFVLGYADGRQRWVSWKRYGDGKALDLSGRRQRRVAEEAADELLRESALLAESGAHLWAPPYDRELPGLERACDLRRAKRWFQDSGLFPGRHVRSGSSRAELLRYKPERRAVLRLDLRLRPTAVGPNTAETLAARALPVAEAARVAAARRVWQAGPCGALAPRMLAHEERTGLLYEEWLDVEVAGHDELALAPSAGALLARLHAEPAPGVEPAGQHLLSSAEELLGTQPPLCALVADLGRVPHGAAPQTVWTHGDFHPDQLARERTGGALHLLDLDRLGPGRPLDDLASWTADHLLERPFDDLRAASNALLEGYAAGGGRVPQPADLAVAVSEALVHRAAGGLRRLESQAVSKAARLLEMAREIAPKGTVFA